LTPTPDWLQEKLFERRIVFVTGRLDDALAAQTAAQIVALAATGDPIHVVLDSGEGTLEAAFALMDVIDAARAPVRLQCQGPAPPPAVAVSGPPRRGHGPSPRRHRRRHARRPLPRCARGAGVWIDRHDQSWGVTAVWVTD
jgi:ATP-dependent Clp protease protease subunit